MRNIKILQLTLFVLIIFVTSCAKQDNEEITKDFDQNDAESLAFTIKYCLTRVAPHYSSETWNNDKENGHVGGYAIVNGSFSESSTTVGYQVRNDYNYDNVSVVFSDFCNNSADPIISGDATMNGNLSYQYSMGHTGEYDGNWILKGSVTCSGKYIGDASFYLKFVEENEYSGTLSFNGTTYQVSDY